jgi:hypothetical protein
MYIYFYTCKHTYVHLYIHTHTCIHIGLWPMGTFSHKNDTSIQSWSNVSYLRQNVSTFSKRSVYGLIIWVGSIDRIHLSHMQSNLLALQNTTSNDSQKIFGWIATEDVYPCNFRCIYLYIWLGLDLYMYVYIYIFIYIYFQYIYIHFYIYNICVHYIMNIHI